MNNPSTAFLITLVLVIDSICIYNCVIMDMQCLSPKKSITSAMDFIQAAGLA